VPLNQNKIVTIITNQIKNIEERCPGYREEILNVIAEIVLYEYQHRIKGTNIQKKINDKCQATGRFLNKSIN